MARFQYILVLLILFLLWCTLNILLYMAKLPFRKVIPNYTYIHWIWMSFSPLFISIVCYHSFSSLLIWQVKKKLLWLATFPLLMRLNIISCFQAICVYFVNCFFIFFVYISIGVFDYFSYEYLKSFYTLKIYLLVVF